MKKKHLILFTSVLLFSVSGFAAIPEKAAPQVSIPDTTSLLLSYVENDSELKNLTIAAKKAALSYDATLIDNGFDISLSTGTVTLQTSEDGSKLTAKPSVKASLPQASNLSFTGQTKRKI